MTMLEATIFGFLITVVIAFVLRCWSPELPVWLTGPKIDSLGDYFNDMLPLVGYSHLNQLPFWVSLFIVLRNVALLGFVALIWAILNFIVSYLIYAVEEIFRSAYNLFTFVLPIKYLDRPEFFENGGESRTSKICIYTLSSILLIASVSVTVILVIKFPESRWAFDSIGGAMIIACYIAELSNKKDS